MNVKLGSCFAAFLGALCVCPSSTYAGDIGGIISSTLTVTEDSQLVDDVTCLVTGAPCIAISGSNITLKLNGFTIIGQADSQTPCNGGPIAGEEGIEVNVQTNVAIQGPGLIQQFRAPGIRLINTTGVKVTGVTTSTNCMSGILVNAGSGNELDNNISFRNGVPTGGCGGI
jgi:hypothetical protein